MNILNIIRQSFRTDNHKKKCQQENVEWTNSISKKNVQSTKVKLGRNILERKIMWEEVHYKGKR